MNLEELVLIDTERKVRGVVPRYYDYTHPLIKVTLKRKLSILFISEQEMKPIHLHETNLTFNTNIPTIGQAQKYFAMKDLLKICADGAEDIYEQFLAINLGNIPIAPDEANQSILNMDFMKLKERFMEFLKNDILLKQIDDYSSNQKLKPFRRSLDKYILTRNIYTHGQLHYLNPDFSFVIEYVDKKELKKKYAIVTEDIMISYNEFYKEILKLITDFQKSRHFK